MRDTDSKTTTIDVSLPEGLPRGDQRGVSPVIGVILMVAITVILAAIIASSVLGFGDTVNKPANAGVDVTKETGDPGQAELTYVTQGSSNSLNVTVRSNGNEMTVQLTEIGDIATIEENASVTGMSVSGSIIQVEEASDGQTEVTLVALAQRGDTKSVVRKRTYTI